MAWPRDDAKLDRVRGADGRARARRDRRARSRQRPLPDELLGDEGLRRGRLPARGRADARSASRRRPTTPRGRRGRPTCGSFAGYDPADPRPPSARTLDAAAALAARARDGRPRALARHAGLRPHGRRADDVHAGLVRRVPGRRRRDAAARRGARAEDRRRRSSGCGSRTRSPRPRWTTCVGRHPAGP